MDSIVDGRVLLLGEGNFSFSAAFYNRYKKKNLELWCSVLESKDELILRYPVAIRFIELLENASNVNVFYEIDATKLNENTFKGIKFDNVIMNFPHTGGKTNLRKCRVLLNDIFKSVGSILRKPTSRFHLTLASNQSGLNAKSINSLDLCCSFSPHNKDSWQAIYRAGYANFLLESTVPFDSNDYPDYICTGYLNENRQFAQNGAETLTFVEAESSISIAHLDVILAPFEHFDFGFVNHLRPYFLHDISFWLLNAGDDEQKLENVLTWQLTLISHGLIKKIWPLPELSYFCAEKKRKSRVYRLLWQSQKCCLTRELCRDLQNSLRNRVAEQFIKQDISLQLR